MPNWADSEISVVLPTENADKFEALFLEEDSDLNHDKERYFARCFKHYSERESNSHGLTRLFVHFDAAWSLNSCMIDGYPQENAEHCPTLEQACKEYDVKRLIAFSREPGIGFEEQITYSKEDGLHYFCQDCFFLPGDDYLDADEKTEDEAEM